MHSVLQCQSDIISIPIIYACKGDVNTSYKVGSDIPIFAQTFTLVLSSIASPPNLALAPTGLHHVLESQCIGLPCQGVPEVFLIHPLAL